MRGGESFDPHTSLGTSFSQAMQRERFFARSVPLPQKWSKVRAFSQQVLEEGTISRVWGST